MKRMLFQILLVFVTSPALAQVSSENYVQTTQRISDTQVLTTTQYYDGLGRPFEKVEQRVTPSGDNLIHLQQYDGLGREWRNWNPIYSSSAFLNPSDVSSLSQSQYDDSHAFSQNNYESNPLNRVIEVEGISEDWKGHSVKSDHLGNTSSFPLNCKYYYVSMSGELQDKGYYPEGRLYVTKTTDEDGHEAMSSKTWQVMSSFSECFWVARSLPTPIIYMTIVAICHLTSWVRMKFSMTIMSVIGHYP